MVDFFNEFFEKMDTKNGIVLVDVGWIMEEYSTSYLQTVQSQFTNLKKTRSLHSKV